VVRTLFFAIYFPFAFVLLTPFAPRFSTVHYDISVPQLPDNIGAVLAVESSGLHPFPLSAHRIYLEVYTDPLHRRRMSIRPGSDGYEYLSSAGRMVSAPAGLSHAQIADLCVGIGINSGDSAFPGTVDAILAAVHDSKHAFSPVHTFDYSPAARMSFYACWSIAYIATVATTLMRGKKIPVAPANHETTRADDSPTTSSPPHPPSPAASASSPGAC
jgi:hypothetical protein